MADIKGNQKIVFDALKGMGFTGIGETAEEFGELMNDSTNRRTVHEALTQNGFTGIGNDFNEFEGLIYEKKPSAPPVQPISDDPLGIKARQKKNMQVRSEMQARGIAPKKPASQPTKPQKGTLDAMPQSYSMVDPGAMHRRLQESAQMYTGKGNNAPQNGGNTPLSAEDIAVMSANADAMKQNAGLLNDRMQNTTRQLKNSSIGGNIGAPLGVSSKLRRGKARFNADKGKFEDTWVTQLGTEYKDINDANAEQQQIDAYGGMLHDANQMKKWAGVVDEHDKDINEQIADAEKEKRQIFDAINAIDKEEKRGLMAKRSLSDMFSGREIKNEGLEGGAKLPFAVTDKHILSAALRSADNRLRVLKAERDDPGFGRGLLDDLTSTDAKTFGWAGVADTQAMRELQKKIDDAKVKGVEPKFTDAEKLLIKNNLMTQQAMAYNNNRGWWYNAGQGFGTTLRFMGEFAATGGGFAGLAKGGLRLGAKGGMKLAESALSKYLINNIGFAGKGLVKSAQYATKYGGMAVGAELGGLAQANTIQIPKTVSAALDRHRGELSISKDGQLSFEGGESLAKSWLYEELKASGENGSELMGPAFDLVPKLLGRVISRTSAGGVLSHLTSNKLWKGSEKALNYMGVQSLWGEGMEEEYGMLRNNILNFITGNEYDPNSESILDLDNQLNTWATVGLTSGILRAPQMAYSGYEGAKYYSHKYNLNQSDNAMRNTFGDNQRYQSVKDMLDNANNKDFGNVLSHLIKNGGLSTEEKKAAVMYASDLIALRGFNIGSAVAAANGQYNAPRTDGYNINGNTIEEVDKDGNVLSTHEYENRDEMKAALWQMQQDRANKDMDADISVMKARPDGQYETLLNNYATQMGMTPEDVEAILAKKPAARTEADAQVIIPFAKMLHEAVYDNTILHEEQSTEDGQDIADVIDFDDPTPENPDVLEARTKFEAAKAARDQLFASNEILAQEVLSRENEQMSHQEILLATYDWTDTMERQILIDYYNQKASFEGLMNRLNNRIEQEAKNRRERSAFKGTINGNPDTQNIYTLTDGQNAFTLVSGNITTDKDGRITGSESGLIIGVDENGDFVQVGDTNGFSVIPTGQTLDDYEAAQLQMLQEQMSAIVDPEGTMGAEETTAEEPVVAEEEAPQTEVVEETEEETEPETALSRIPTDEEGNPLYEQATPEDAYDALYEQVKEQSILIAQGQANAAKKELETLTKKLEKGEFKGNTVQEQIAEMQGLQQQIEDAKNRVNFWNSVISVPNNRRLDEANAAVSEKPATETQSEQPAGEAPEYRYDTPQAARERGYKVVEGNRIDRQEEKPMPQGMEVEVQYSTKDSVKGRMAVSELSEVQGSHLTNGQTNDKHFIPEAQPKAEFGADRQTAAQTNANEANFKPELMLTFNGTQSAYSGSASQTNRRGEVIQGNGRRNLAEYIYAPGNEKVAEKYKQYLMEHATELGSTPEAIAAMEKPFAHIVLDITDEEAIRLGQFTAADLESGGKKIPEVSATVTKLGDNYGSLANILLRNDDPDATLADRIEANMADAIRWLNQGNYINNTEAKTLGENKDAARQFFKDLLTDIIFKDANPDLRAMFYELPKNIQSAIVSVIGRELTVNKESSILKDIQESIQAFHELSTSSPQFAGVKGKNFEERYAAARAAVNDWLRQINLDGSKNIGKYSNFAIELAMMYASLKDQKTLSNYLRQYYDLVNGSTRELGLFDAPATGEVLTKEQALKQIFGIDNGTEGNVPVADNPQSSQGGEETSPGTTESSEPRPTTEGTPHNTGGSEVNAPESGVEETPADKPQSDREKFIAEHPLTEEEINSANASEAQKVLARGYLDLTNEYTTEMAKAAYLYIYNKKVAAQSQAEVAAETPTETPKTEAPQTEQPTEKPVEKPASDKPQQTAQEAAQAKLQAALAKLKKHGKKPNNSQADAYSVENLTPEQIEDMFEVVEAGAELGYTLLDGVESKEDWLNQMRGFIGEQLKDATGYTDAEVTELLEDMWVYPYAVEGQTKTVSEWANEKGIKQNENNNETGETNVGTPQGEQPGSNDVGNSTGTQVEEQPTNNGSSSESGVGTSNGPVANESDSGSGEGQPSSGTRSTRESTGTTKKTDRGNGGSNSGSESGNRGRRTNVNGGTKRSGEKPTLFDQPGESGVGQSVGVEKPEETPADIVVEQPKKQISDISKEKVHYEPSSVGGKFAIGSVIPSGIADAITNAFKRLKEKFFPKNNTLDFVREELGYKSNEEMLSDFDSGKTNGLAAEQVDAVALAIGKMKEGKSFIVGDMTGVGKGRTAAALIRWGKQHGKKVLFITEKAGLFSDMYRDLTDIGCDYMPFVTNSDTDANITDSDGNKVIPKPNKSAQSALWQSGKDELPKNKKGRQYDFVMTTYSQASNPKGADAKNKLEWLQEYAKDAIVIMDESHNASGESNRGAYFKEMVKNAGGVTFLSATYAKRPDNMMLYALKSSMSELHMPVGNMLEAIKEYGVAMQELMASALFGSGEMIRRERDMSDVKTTWTEPREIYTEEEYEKCRKTSDKTMDLINDIIDFQREYVNPIVKEHEKEYEDANNSAAMFGLPQTHAANTSYKSQVSNVMGLMVYAMKAKKAAEMAIEQIKQGKKPVIAVENTFGSYIDDLDDEVQSADFSPIFEKGINFSLKYTIAQYKIGDDKKYHKDKDTEVVYNAEDELDDNGVRALESIRQRIQAYLLDGDKIDLTLSPIDLVKQMIADAGYSCGEITGRSTQLVRKEGGGYKKASISQNKKEAARKFNGGSKKNPIPENEQYQALVLNVAGATGISLHSSKTFGNQNPRTMIILQPARDVNTEVQMRGRIDRTGQAHRGEYFYVTSPIPAEQKLTMMLKQKLASLDAQSVGTKDVSSNKVESQDMDNKYGDEVCLNFLLEHLTDINAFLEGGLAYNNKTREWEGHPGLLYDVLKDIQRMPCDMQEFVINELTQRYADQIEYLNQNGINDLETTTMNLEAVTIDKATFIKGKDNESENEFAHDTTIERVEVNVLKKPMRSADIKKKMKELDALDEDGNPKEGLYGQTTKIAEESIMKKIEDRQAKYEEQEAKLEEKIRKEHPKKDDVSEEDYENMVKGWPSLLEMQNKHNADMAQLKADLQVQYNAIAKAAQYLKPGRPYLVPLTDEINDAAAMMYGRFIGFQMKNGDPRQAQAVFAVKDSRAMINIPLVNKKDVIVKILQERNDLEIVALERDKYGDQLPLEETAKKRDEWWDRMIPKNTSRQVRFMITGNVVQACGSLGKYKGQIVTFTRKDKETGEITLERGMILAENFDPENFKVRREVEKKDVWEDYNEIKDENSSISCHREGNNMVVKFEKRKGEKLSEHPVQKDEVMKGLAMNGEIRPSGKTTILCVVKEDNVEKALSHLYEEYGYTKEELFVMPDSTEKPDAIVRTNRPYQEIIEQYKDKYGYSKYDTQRKIKEMLKRYKMDVNNEGLKNDIREAVQLRQAYYRRDFASRESSRLAWEVLIHDGNIEKYKDDKDIRERETFIREAILEELEARGFKGTALHLEQGKMSFDDVRNLFDQLNDTSTEEGKAKKALFEKVMAKVSKLPMEIFLNEKIENDVGGFAGGRIVNYNWKYMNADYISDDAKASTVLHELIHTVTAYADHCVEDGLEHLLDQDMIDAVNELHSIFDAIKNNPTFTHDGERAYGLTNVREMLSEAGSNTEFRRDLKRTNLWARIKAGFLTFFGINTNVQGGKEVNAYEQVMERLEYLIENFKEEAWNEFYKGTRMGGYGYKKMDNQMVNPISAIDKAAASFREEHSKHTELKEESAKELYNERVDSVGYVMTEAYQDSMLALKTAQNAIVKDGEIPDSQNAYMAENLMHGKNKNEQDKYNAEHRDPIIKVVNAILDKMGWTMKEMNQYLLTKSGLERNRELFVRDWFEVKRKFNPHRVEDLNSTEQDIYRRLEESIEDRFEDGEFGEEEKRKLLKQALQDAHDLYLSDLEEGWGKVKVDRSLDLRIGNSLELGMDTFTLADYLHALDKFINDNLDDYDPEEHDYSGLTEMYGNEKGEYNEDAIIEDLMANEKSMDDSTDLVDTLWDKLKAASDYGLERYRESGMKTDEQLDRIKKMFNWYVPMRGFDKNTNEDMYQYFTSTSNANSYVGGLVKHAEGRKSTAKSPLATMFAMAYKAIGDCNQNLVNQHLYRLCQAHRNDLIIVSDAWAKLDEATGEWEEVWPDIPEDASTEEVRQITLAYEETMRQLEKHNKAMKIKGKPKFDYKPLDKKKRAEHTIEVMINGQKRLMTVVGNPRAAQAMNGKTRWENSKNIIAKVNAWMKNKMSSAFTSYSPTFALRNMMRDFSHFRIMLGVREGHGYAHAATKYYMESFPRPLHPMGGIGMVGLFKKYREGTLDESKEIERDFKDFMDNGGITGYVQMQKVDDIEKEMVSLNKQMKDKKAIRLNNKLWDLTLGLVEAYNEAIENNARFATYRASRHYANRTKARSAYDAKEITVNFNRKGSGNKVYGFKSESSAVTFAAQSAGVSAQVLGEGRIFFNATVQAIATTFKNFQNPDGTLNKKYIAKWAAMYAMPPFMFGFALPLINKALVALLGSDDDDPYANLPEWTRRKNICIYIGNNNFVTIPIGQELAAFLALGDIAAANTYAENLKPIDRSWFDEFLGVLTTFSPVDLDQQVTKGGMLSKDAINETLGKTFSVLTPIISVANNRAWTGRPIYKEDRFPNDEYKPEYQQVYQSTNPVLVEGSKKLHELGGGNDRARGKDWSEWNPAIIQYLWEQYTGGPGKVFSNTISLGKDAKDVIIEGEAPDFNMRKVEGVKAFIQQGDDRTSYYRTNAKYWKYKEDADKYKYDNELSTLEKQAKKDPVARMKLEELQKSKEYMRYQIIKEANSSKKKIGKIGLDDLRKEINNTTDRNERREKQRAYNELVKAVVDKLEELDEM